MVVVFQGIDSRLYVFNAEELGQLVADIPNSVFVIVTLIRVRDRAVVAGIPRAISIQVVLCRIRRQGAVIRRVWDSVFVAVLGRFGSCFPEDQIAWGI